MVSRTARLVAWMRAWEDFDRFPTGDLRRFELAQRIIEDACRRLPGPLVVVQGDDRDGGLAPFGRDGWGFFLVVDVLHGRVRATLDQLWVRDGLVRIRSGSRGAGDDVPLLEARPLLHRRLERRVEESRACGEHEGHGRQWYGELTETWNGMWRDQSFLVLDGFVNPRRGVLWDVMDQAAHWQTPRWAWLAYQSPLRDSTFFAEEGVSREDWTWEDPAELIETIARRGSRGHWKARKWPDLREDSLVRYDEEELGRALRILEEAEGVPLRFDPDSIPIKALRERPKGITVQQRACHYLVRDAAGPKLTTTKAAELLGIGSRTEVARMARKCQDAMHGDQTP